MALTLDNAPATRQLAATASSLTYSFTRAAGDGAVFVSVAISGSATVTGVTLGGEAMTQLAVYALSGTVRLYLFRIINPSTSGAQNVVVTASASANFILATTISWSGDVDPAINTNVANATGTTLANPLTVSDGAFIVIAGAHTSVDVTAGTNVTSTTSANPLTGYFGPRSGAGSTSLTINASASNPIASLTAEVKEYVPPVEIDVTDTDLFFSPYNWFSDGSGSLQSNNVLDDATYALTNTPGAYLKTKFTGTSVGLNVDVSALTGASVSAGNYPRLLHSVDGAAFTSRQLTSADSVVSIATGLSDATHTLVVYFAAVAYNTNDRWTTPVMAVKVTGLTLDSGKDVATPDLFSGRMLCYGDSHTEGHEADGVGVTLANQNAVKTWPILLARAFECEVGVVAFAAQGYTVTTGGTSNIPDCEDAWDFYSSGESRLFSGALSPAPDFIVSAQGDNDSDDSATATAVENLIDAWRAAAADAAIILVLPPNLTVETGIRNGHTAAADANSFVVDPNADLLAFGPWLSGTHLSAYGHAIYAALAAKQIQNPPVEAVAEAVWTYVNRELTA